MKKDEKLTASEKLQKILKLVKPAVKLEEEKPTNEKEKIVEVELETVTLEDGTVFEAESFEAGIPVFIVQDEERIPVPVGEYTLEDGRVLVITEEGIIGELKDAAAAEETTEETTEETETEMSEADKQKAELKTLIKEVVTETLAEMAEEKPEDEPIKKPEKTNMSKAIKPNPEGKRPRAPKLMADASPFKQRNRSGFQRVAEQLWGDN